MTKSFVFIGDTGPSAPQILDILKNYGINAKRISPDKEPSTVMESNPMVIVFSEDFENRSQYVYSLREQSKIDQALILMLINESTNTEMEKAFRDGADDICLKNNLSQFKALVATMTKQDSWKVIRAPAGKIVLAHQNRLWRLKVGQTLRRKGFDTYFAANTEELIHAMETQKPRAIVSDLNLSEQSVIPIVTRSSTDFNKLPWILTASTSEMKAIDMGAVDASTVRLLVSDTDPESVTYLLNELLTPDPPKLRRSPRILYATPISFRPNLPDVKPFQGFSFNVNSGGLFVRTTTLLPLHSQLEVAFRPPHGRGEVRMIAQVVWRKEYGQGGSTATPPGMGIQFIESLVADIKGFEAGYNALLEAAETDTNPSVLPVMSTMPPAPVIID